MIENEDIPRDTKDVSLPLDNALQGGKEDCGWELRFLASHLYQTSH